MSLIRKERDQAKSGASTDDIKTPKWMHFKSMSFLRDVVLPRNGSSNLEVYIHVYYNIII
jgi:hypothetical protein